MTEEIKTFFHKKASGMGYNEPCRCGDICYKDDNSFVRFISADTSFIRVDIISPTSDTPRREVWHTWI